MAYYRVLYYPDFSPKPLWLRRILLLADGVIRMVPADVDPKDPDDVKRLVEALPSSLVSEAPGESDVAVQFGQEALFERAFELLAKEHASKSNEIRINIRGGGRLTIADHVFVHDAKLSGFVLNQLRQKRLIMRGDFSKLAGERFVVVRKEASDVILASLASRMANRLGVDAITDKPLPFAVSTLSGTSDRPQAGVAEGSLLSALARVSIPAAVGNLSTHDYCDLRNSYTGIREIFKRLTAEYAQSSRATRTSDPERFAAKVESVAAEFHKEFSAYRRTRFARQFRIWTPLYVAGALAIPRSLVPPEVSVGLAAAGAAVTIIARHFEVQRSPNDRVFNMLTGLRADIIKRSQLTKLA